MTSVSNEDLSAWITNYVAKMVNLDPANVDVDKSFQLYGLDSAAAVELTCEMSDFLGTNIEPTVIFEHRTIRKLTDYVASTTETVH